MTCYYKRTPQFSPHFRSTNFSSTNYHIRSIRSQVSRSQVSRNLTLPSNQTGRKVELSHSKPSIRKINFRKSKTDRKTEIALEEPVSLKQDKDCRNGHIIWNLAWRWQFWWISQPPCAPWYRKPFQHRPKWRSIEPSDIEFEDGGHFLVERDLWQYENKP